MRECLICKDNYWGSGLLCRLCDLRYSSRFDYSDHTDSLITRIKIEDCQKINAKLRGAPMEPKPLNVKDWNLEAPDADAPTQRERDEHAAEMDDARRREL